MGRTLLFVSAIASAFLLFECQKTQPPQAPTATIADTRSCLSIVPDLILWDASAAVPVQKGSVQIGEKLTLLGQTRRAEVNGKDRELVRVRQDTGTEGWFGQTQWFQTQS